MIEVTRYFSLSLPARNSKIHISVTKINCFNLGVFLKNLMSKNSLIIATNKMSAEPNLRLTKATRFCLYHEPKHVVLVKEKLCSTDSLLLYILQDKWMNRIKIKLIRYNIYLSGAGIAQSV
jgi:hypothetical protein